MDIHKTIHEAYEATKHWHFPLFLGLFSYIKLSTNLDQDRKLLDLGEAPGDNIIFISLSRRK